MHGQILRQLDEVGVDIKGTWNWLKKADLKSSTEALSCATQEQALRTNYVKFHVEKSVKSPLCRMCHEKGESATHVISECYISVNVITKYKLLLKTVNGLNPGVMS